MTLKKCLRCGGAAVIRAETEGRRQVVRAVCSSCGQRGKPAADAQAGAASEYWAGMNWNCGRYEQEGTA